MTVSIVFKPWCARDGMRLRGDARCASGLICETAAGVLQLARPAVSTCERIMSGGTCRKRRTGVTSARTAKRWPTTRTRPVHARATGYGVTDEHPDAWNLRWRKETRYRILAARIVADLRPLRLRVKGIWRVCAEVRKYGRNDGACGRGKRG